MIAFGASGATPKHRMAQIAAGLGVLPGVIVDQHFQQRNRLGRLLSLIAQNPSLLGLGVDEDTAGVVGPDHVMEVIGRGSITVVDGAGSETDAWEVHGHRPLMISGVVLHSLPAGYRFDLRRRERVATPDPPRTARRRGRVELASADGPTAGRGGSPWPTRRGRRRTEAARDPNAREAAPAERRTPVRRAGARSRPCASSRRASCAARTTGRASRSSACSSTSASSRSSRRTSSRASPTRSSRCCRRSRTTPARSAGAAASSRGCATGRGPATSPSTSRSSSRTSPAPTSATARRARAGPIGQYNCIYEYREEAVGLEAGRMAVALVNHLVAPDDPDVFFDFAAELERLIRLAERQAFGPSTQALIDEAVSRDIPFIRLDRHSLVQFGHGVHQQRIRATMTSQTSAIGVDVASDKSLTNRLLDSAGLPVPRADVVDDRGRRRSPPRSGSASRASSSRSTATTAAASTSTCAPRRRSGRPSTARSRRAAAGDVVVETYVAGNDYRCLVIGGKVAAIAERVPASRRPATASTPSASSSTSPTATRGAASATRRC